MMNKVKYYREQKGMSQKELADRVGLGVETIKAIEDGVETPVSIWTLAKIAFELEHKPSEIFVDGISEEDRERERERAFRETAIAMYRAKEALLAIVSEDNWTIAEDNDPKIADAEAALNAALDAAGITVESRGNIFDAAVGLACAYRDLALILGFETAFGLTLMKTSQNPQIKF